MTQLFICHSSDDKDEVARPLALSLKQLGMTVWFDEFSLKIGDSLRQSIDDGLRRCDFGIVILSPSFFEKAWPQRELDGLTSRELNEGRNLILPIWHKVNVSEVRRYSPPLADKVAFSTQTGLDALPQAILKATGECRKRRVEELEKKLHERDEASIHFCEGLTPGPGYMEAVNAYARETNELRKEIERHRDFKADCIERHNE